MGDFEIKQKITPTLMFVGDQCGNAEEAIQFYTTLFKHSSVGNILRYGEGATPNKANTIQHVDFVLENQTFAAMDSAYEHNLTINEAISLIVKCDTQEEIDYYWDKLSAVPEAEQCGWLKDKYGFSWQIVPTIMNDMMQNKVGNPYEWSKCSGPPASSLGFGYSALQNSIALEESFVILTLNDTLSQIQDKVSF